MSETEEKSAEEIRLRLEYLRSRCDHSDCDKDDHYVCMAGQTFLEELGALWDAGKLAVKE